jgi:hypothetical protein
MGEWETGRMRKREKDRFRDGVTKRIDTKIFANNLRSISYC